MNPQIWWYVARASGVVGWILLTFSVLWGILIPAKFTKRQRPAWMLDLHRGLAGLTIGFVAIHLVAIMADSYVEFGLTDLVIPFVSDWKPVPVALGVLAMWLLVIVQATSLAMKHLPRRIWHRIHMMSYLTFFLTSLHGTFAGTDATSPLYQATSLAALAAVIFATVFRILIRRRPRSQPTPSTAAPAESSGRVRRSEMGTNSFGHQSLKPVKR
ncbi:MAG: hypothetical protein HKN03_13150 [Acidimicrobiales bacterium]|nr:hypothetical protein [Acidimicrobiales bacterium]